MKKLVLVLLPLSLLLGACQQRPATQATAPTPTPANTPTPATTPTPPTAATPAPPAATAPTGDLTAFAGEYTGNFSERKKADQKTLGLTEVQSNLTLNPDGTFILTLFQARTSPADNQEVSQETTATGTFVVEGATMRLTTEIITAGDGTETTATSLRPLVLMIEENGQRLTIPPDESRIPTSPDFFQRS